MQLRRGRSGDLAALASLVVSERMNPLFLEPARFVVGVEEGGALVGGGQIRPIGPPEAGAAELASVVVRADRRGQGIGGRIVDELLRNHAGAAGEGGGARKLFLLTTDGAVGFYLRRGFATVSPAQAPGALRVEQALGSLVAGLAKGEACVAMRWAGPATREAGPAAGLAPDPSPPEPPT